MATFPTSDDGKLACGSQVDAPDFSVYVIGAIVFVGDSSRGILFPVLWGLCRSLNGSLVDMGYLVAMFSFGRLLVTTPLGYMCDNYRHKIPLLLSSFTLLLGSILWANSYPTSKLTTLYISQFLMGCGSGSLGEHSVSLAGRKNLLDCYPHPIQE